MTSFTRKKIDTSHPVCFRLKQAREAAGLSVAEMASRTRLSTAYITALEACEFEKLPHGTIYQKNFIKRYLDALNVPSGPYIQQFLIEEGHVSESSQGDQSHPRKPTPLRAFHSLPDLMKYISVSVIMVCVLGYLGLQVHRILEPPALTLIEPIDGHITADKQIVIRGVSDPETDISINGQNISYTEEGRFEQPLDLVEGVNTIVVSATKKHGKTTTETRYVTQRDIQHISVEPVPDTKS